MKRFVLILLLLASTLHADPLPQSVYDQLADLQVATVTLPQGDYELKRQLLITRSNVTLKGAGCNLLVDPTDGATWSNKYGGCYPVKVVSTPTGTHSISPNGMRRQVSKLQGQVKASTDRLLMVEPVDVQPGEIVLLWLGVNTSDPVEVRQYRKATVKSVEAGVVIFTSPIGVDVPNYYSLDGLRIAMNTTDNSLLVKVAEWGTWGPGNWSKGYGFHHGMERYVGGMTSGVVIDDLSLTYTVAVDSNKLPNGAWAVTGYACDGLTVNRPKLHNPHGNIFHCWRSNNYSVNDAVLTGQGSARENNSRTMTAVAVTAWGGDSLKVRNMRLYGKDISFIGTEVGSTNTQIDGLDMDVEYTSYRTSNFSPQAFGFYGGSGSGPIPLVRNAKIAMRTTGGVGHTYYSYSPFRSDGMLEFANTPLTDWFDIGYQKRPEFDGQVKVFGVVYGPPQVEQKTITVPWVYPYGAIPFPKGLYQKIEFRVKNLGDCRGIADSYGYNYWGASYSTYKDSANWMSAAGGWYQINPGQAGMDKFNGSIFQAWFNSTAQRRPMVLEYRIKYLPKN